SPPLKPGQIPPGAIATYPVPPTVPGAPTVIPGEVESAQASGVRSQPSKAPAAIAARPVDPQFSASAESSQQAVAQSRSPQNTSDAANQSGSTAFDTIPQVAEARSYFQQRWKPPEGLTQVLEYSLQIDSNGSIQTITPLKQASADYVDRTGIPLIGEPFVSPLKSGRSAKIRLVLEPDGKVQTFLE
ncbi:MAG: hypothetical protein HC866_12305, partial [Leptolyngbyaceae cyanobacterium RU_5_1]|nr:hypothetical protein [Leptolyngbyaceae cyanobacterium RU_5_1]